MCTQSSDSLASDGVSDGEQLSVLCILIDVLCRVILCYILRCVVGKECVHRAVIMITDVVDSLGTDGVSRSKQLCYACLSDYVDSASRLLTVYMQHLGQGHKCFQIVKK